MSRYKTPLRYPGGKQKLAPFLIEVIEANNLVGGHYIEPYAGGAGMALELLLNDKVSHIHLNDCCPGIYAFWRSVLFKSEEFCRRIAGASLTVKEWQRQKSILANPSKHNQIDVGFSLFFLNRCNRSGITSAGLIGGLDQSGEWKMDARFPRNELINRIEVIARKKDSITVKNWDAEKFISEYIPKIELNALVYCDPPYFHKGDRLYLNHYTSKDHTKMAQVIQNRIKHHWMVSYDNANEILGYYSKRRSFLYNLQYNLANVYKGTEVFFFSDRLKMPSKSTIASIDKSLKAFVA